MWLGVGWRRTEGSERPLCHFGEGVILRRQPKDLLQIWTVPFRCLSERSCRTRRDPSPLAQDDAFPSSPKGYL